MIMVLWQTLVGQTTWQPVSDLALNDLHLESELMLPQEFQVWQLDRKELIHSLAEGYLEIPMPDGSTKMLQVEKISNMHPSLASRYPMIRTYLLFDDKEASLRGRADLSTHGLNVVLESHLGEIYIDAIRSSDRLTHISYYTRDYKVDPELRESYVKHEHIFPFTAQDWIDLEPVNSPFQRSAMEPVDLQLFELALSCTGEYAQKHGGTIEGALSAINTALTRINFLLESEVAVRLQLIEDNDSLIFLDAQADPFTNGDAGQMALENNNFLTARLPGNAYDVGHVFGTNCGGVVGTSGGIGTVCSGTKGFGSSCEISTNDRFYIGIVCHELGHQFGARHTWNHCPPVSQDQFSSATAYEPGSGSTIMSYAGACGDQNIQFDSDPYYHINSIVDISSFLINGGGQSCADAIPTLNHRPTVSTSYENGFAVPILTPFKLVAKGEDVDGDTLSFNWEQYDAGVGAGANTPLGQPQGTAPLFRSSAPTTSPTRIFPAMSKILDNAFDDTEVLPDYSRPLTFRVAARDNRAEGGGVAWTEVAFRSTEAAGPFEVVSFNDSDTLSPGEYVEIIWDVANTDQAPVNCQLVHILMSTNGGNTFSDTLISDTPNDGSEFVVIPNQPGDRVRIMVEAADNIFFAVNTQNITILEPDAPGFGVDVAPHLARVCLPEEIEIQLQTFPVGGFVDSLDIGVANAPENIIINLPSRMQSGDTLGIQLDASAVTESGVYQVEFFIAHSSADTAFRTIVLEAVSSDFSDLAELMPDNGSSGLTIRPTFSWLASDQAEAYKIDLSPNPAFESGFTSSGILSDQFTFDTLLEENTLYYWRLQPSNVCGEGSYSDIHTFHTLNLSCESFSAEDLPQSLSQSTTPIIQSLISVDQTGTVSDVNVPNIAGFHEAFNNLTFELVSPGGQSVKMISGECGFSNRQFRLGFDDESAQAFTCQTSFTGQVFRPTDSLSRMIGEEILGDWTLVVSDSMVGAGGLIDDWSLELCGSITPIPPVQVNLDTLIVPINQTVALSEEILLATDDEASTQELIYTLVNIPSRGTLALNGQPLEVGNQFSQHDINMGRLSYVHTASDTLADRATFTLIDGTGGWLPIQELAIVISDEVVSAKEYLDPSHWNIFPNPTEGLLHFRFDQIIVSKAEIWTWDGRKVWDEEQFPSAHFSIRIDLPPGSYFVRIISDQKVGSRLLSVIR